MREEEEYSILQNNFREWFGDTVPASPPFPAETDRSIGTPVPIVPRLPAEADHSIGVPVLIVPRLPAEADQLNLRMRRRHEDHYQKLFELLGFGFSGAVSLGAVVGLIIVFFNLTFWGWYGNHWPNQIVIIFFATLLGFTGGLSKGFINQQRDRYLQR